MPPLKIKSIRIRTGGAATRWVRDWLRDDGAEPEDWGEGWIVRLKKPASIADIGEWRRRIQRDALRAGLQFDVYTSGIDDFRIGIHS